MGPEESDDQNAIREIEEEVGIDSKLFEESQLELVKVGTIPYQIPKDNFFCNIYLLIYDGPIKCDPDEVDFVEYWKMSEILTIIAMKKEKITPDSVMCFQEIMKNDEMLARIYDPEFKKEE